MQELSKLKNKKVYLLAGVAVVILSVSIWALTKDTSNNSSIDTVAENSGDQTTSDAPTAQSDFTDGDERPIPEDIENEATVEDNQGRNVEKSNEADWSVSPTGEITVYSPAKNSVISSGGTFTGASSLGNVSFRLIDDITGVIAQGQLNVVNGKFSGTFNFSTTASEGRLDVFATQADLVEYSNVEVPVRFK